MTNGRPNSKTTMFTHSKKPPLVGRLVPTGPDRARAVNTCLHRRLYLALSPPSLRPLLEPPLFSSPPFAGLPPSTMPLLDLPMPSPPPSVSLPHRLHPCLSSISAAFMTAFCWPLFSATFIPATPPQDLTAGPAAGWKLVSVRQLRPFCCTRLCLQ